MGYKLECQDCGNEYERAFLSFSKRCPKCGSTDLLMLNPSKNAGWVLLLGALLMIVCPLLYLCTLSAPSSSTFTRVVVTALAALGVFLLPIGVSIAFGQRR